MKGIEDRYWVPSARFRFGPLDLRSHRVAGLRNFVSEDIEVRDRIQVVLIVLTPVDNDLHLAEKTDQVENSDGRLHDHNSKTQTRNIVFIIPVICSEGQDTGSDEEKTKRKVDSADKISPRSTACA